MSMSLSGERCTACHKDAPRVTVAEIAELSSQVPEWKIVEIEGIPRLERSFRFASYPAALAFTQAVGEEAEREDHHPAILTEARRVRVAWWTHAIRYLHRNDFIMAARTDEIASAMGANPSRRAS